MRLYRFLAPLLAIALLAPWANAQTSGGSGLGGDFYPKAIWLQATKSGAGRKSDSLWVALIGTSTTTPSTALSDTFYFDALDAAYNTPEYHNWANTLISVTDTVSTNANVYAARDSIPAFAFQIGVGDANGSAIADADSVTCSLAFNQAGNWTSRAGGPGIVPPGTPYQTIHSAPQNDFSSTNTLGWWFSCPSRWNGHRPLVGTATGQGSVWAASVLSKSCVQRGIRGWRIIVKRNGGADGNTVARLTIRCWYLARRGFGEDRTTQ